MDEKRILTKIDEMDSYLAEMEKIKPLNYEEYVRVVEKKRACERLLQITIETVMDVCNTIVSQLKLGLPSQEEDVFTKLKEKKILSAKMADTLNDMRGFRNILVHKYGVVNDEIVFEMLSERLEDFEKFKEEVLSFLKS